jgi:hypothetical protein
MVRKNRQSRGEQLPQAKLTEKAVRAIRASTEPLSALARRFDCSCSAIAHVRRGNTWRHVK